MASGAGHCLLSQCSRGTRHLPLWPCELGTCKCWRTVGPSDIPCSWGHGFLGTLLPGRQVFLHAIIPQDWVGRGLLWLHGGHRQRTLRQTPRDLRTDAHSPGSTHVVTQDTARTTRPQSRPGSRHPAGSPESPTAESSETFQSLGLHTQSTKSENPGVLL